MKKINEENISIDFISQKPPNLLTSSDGNSIKIMNLVAVLTKSIQDNRKFIQKLAIKQNQEIEELKKANDLKVQEIEELKKANDLKVQEIEELKKADNS